MEFNEGQKNAFDVIMGGKNVFLTGQGGVGKSELIKKVRDVFIESQKVISITSLTGISAIPLKGMTIHSWAGIGLGDEDAADLLQKVRKKRGACGNWKKTDILVIDEISMMAPDLLMKLNFIGKAIRRDLRPFGGIQLILSGDFCQLPPVKIDVYCFECPTWAECNLVVCHLTQNMRQDDPLFQKVLSEIRFGKLSEEGRQLLNSCFEKKLEGDILPTKLFSHRKSVDTINEKNLKAIINDNNKPEEFSAIDYMPEHQKATKEQQKIYIAALEKSCPAKKLLILAVGAQVMLIQNLSTEMGLANGSRGVVIRFEEQRPVVKFMNGLEILIKHYDWDVILGEGILISRRQIPLILAYSATFHKSQGATLDCVELDLGDTIFADGQFYTGLSRVRSTAGLTISNLDFSGIVCNPRVKEFYMQIELSK